jgi:hypothetical protein
MRTFDPLKDQLMIIPFSGNRALVAHDPRFLHRLRNGARKSDPDRGMVASDPGGQCETALPKRAGIGQDNFNGKDTAIEKLARFLSRDGLRHLVATLPQIFREWVPDNNIWFNKKHGLTFHGPY